MRAERPREGRAAAAGGRPRHQRKDFGDTMIRS
jgi:hypothetical protein